MKPRLLSDSGASSCNSGAKESGTSSDSGASTESGASSCKSGVKESSTSSDSGASMESGASSCNSSVKESGTSSDSGASMESGASSSSATVFLGQRCFWAVAFVVNKKDERGKSAWWNRRVRS
ncbi:Os04g0328366 [Oryza sativa Japonica Group]|nr:Os04g0328366 [Oryza sativa Japonica Group]